jgi:hypothetical protein
MGYNKRPRKRPTVISTRFGKDPQGLDCSRAKATNIGSKAPETKDLPVVLNMWIEPPDTNYNNIKLAAPVDFQR